MLIIGIDPGISGSICFLQDGKILDVIEMPTMTEGKKNKKQVNGSQIYNEICKRINGIEKQEIRIVIEHFDAMSLGGRRPAFPASKTAGIAGRLSKQEGNTLSWQAPESCPEPMGTDCSNPFLFQRLGPFLLDQEI